MKRGALIILDGWGLKEGGPGNAMELANPTNFQRLWRDSPHTALMASGEAVGLPAGQMGNSEVGHLNIGAGRILYQSLDQIRRDLEEKKLLDNPVFMEAFRGTKRRRKKLHLLGLVSDGGVHSHLDHLKGLLSVAKDEGLTEVYVHAFMDGRDTLPESGKGFLQSLEDDMEDLGLGTISTISGRYYAMDRDKRWDRVQRAYDNMVRGSGEKGVGKAREVMEASYAKGITDEFILPTLLDSKGLITEGDTVFFYNFRPDRAREMTMALTQRPFDHFPVEDLNLDYYCMTQYDPHYEGLHVIYPPKSVEGTIGEYLSSLGKKQFRIAETEKYAHVTFFFNGGQEEAFEGETRVLVPSPSVPTYDRQPEMSCFMVKDLLIQAIEQDSYDFFLVNFANPDMVGHTGVLEAAVQAISAVDQALGEVAQTLEEHGIPFIITADHGNAEEMIDEESGETLTQHSLNPVPMILAGAGNEPLQEGGKLCDIVPTLLDVMGLERRDEMTGLSLRRKK